LIAAAKKGDAAALSELADNYKYLIRSVANKFYIVGGDKEDLLQEGMLGLFGAVNSYDENKGAFPSFVKLCVVRSVIGAVKKAGDKNKPLANYVELSEIADVPSEDAGPMEILEYKDLSEKLAYAIESDLTPLEKQTLGLFVEGYDYETICTTLGKSYKAVDGALQRARKKLLVIKENL